MLQRIKDILRDEGVDAYLLREVSTQSCEMYYVKQRLDMLRSSDTKEYRLTLYRDIYDGERSYRGNAELILFESMTDADIRRKVRDGYRAASLVKDPPYPLAPPLTDAGEDVTADLYKIAKGYSHSLFLHDTAEDAYINSAEIFSSLICTRIQNSEGLDVTTRSVITSGELVVQCKSGEDAELFDYFRYEGECYDALAARTQKMLSAVRDRSRAERCVRSGTYDIIIEGECVREVLGYVLWQADAKNIHTGYSTARPGESVGTSLPDITASVTERYSREGIRMADTPLVRGGVLVTSVGGIRHSSYLGTEPTGEYKKLTAHCKGVPMAELTRGRYLHIVSFSDFQFDPLDGYLGGEIRLGYLCDGERRIPVTGCSVSGNYSASADTFEFSSERYTDYTYDGPLALRIGGASVSGITEE